MQSLIIFLDMRINYTFNWKFIVSQLGLILIAEAFFMIFPIITGLIYHEKSVEMMVLSAEITFVAGLIMYLTNRKNVENQQYGKRESYLLVSLAWILMSLAGSLPFVLSGSIPKFYDAFFETMSGFTTTGSSILTDIESLPKNMLFWRSETHWIGGLGIIVLFVALFPYLKTKRIYLFNAEASVVVEQKAMPKIMDIARLIWIVYMIITTVEVILLLAGGMNLFESLCHTFGTVGTGGFSTRNASIGAFSPYIQYVITIFMILSGVNFALYLYLLKKKFSNFAKNEELRLYLTIILLSGFTITAILLIKGYYHSFETAFRQAFFQVASIITATGYATTDYLQWPHAAIIVIIMLMFIGGSAGSTSGGIKVIRHLIFFKSLNTTFKKQIHEDIVAPVYYNKKRVDNATVNAVLIFIITYLIVVFAGTMFLVFDNVDITTAFGSVLTAIGGIGPGLGLTGPAGNFSQIPVESKILLSFVMLIGRLELFTFFVIFTKTFRKG